MQGGDASLEKLQEHQNLKIANQATNIIEKHYAENLCNTESLQANDPLQEN